MIRRRRKRSLQTAIISSFTGLMFLILSLVMAGIALRVNRNISAVAISRTEQTVMQADQMLAAYLKNSLETFDFLENLVVQEKVELPLNAQMDIVLRQHADVANIVLLSEGGEILHSAADLRIDAEAVKKMDWFRKTQQSEEATVLFSAPYSQRFFDGKLQNVITVSSRVLYGRDGVTDFGILMMDIRLSALERVLSRVRLGENGYVYLIDSEDNVIFHPRQMRIRAGIEAENTNAVRENGPGNFYDEWNGRQRFVVVEAVQGTRWKLIGVAYVDEVTSLGMGVVKITTIYLVAGLLLSVLLSVVFGKIIVRPINQLTELIRTVENGNLDVVIPEQRYYEMDTLSGAFRNMLHRIKGLMRQIIREQEQKRLYEFEALQAQINPHFLYNTLDSIVWMQERGLNREAISMVTALARLFRISISKGRNTITVAEEIEHVRNYLIIQSIRYKNKFSYEFSILPETLDLITIKLILQPIVENAIYHGLDHCCSDEGVIEISNRLEDGDMVFSVRDNGLGMSAEKMQEILRESPGKSGIGLKNVHERIRLSYGDAYGIQIESELDVGTCVRIRMPAYRRDESPYPERTGMGADWHR